MACPSPESGSPGGVSPGGGSPDDRFPGGVSPGGGSPDSGSPDDRSPCGGSWSRTQRSTVRRLPARGAYDHDAICAIFDEALFCHVGVAAPHGPLVLPTIHARSGDDLYLHGSTSNALLRVLAGGAEACVTATILDGLVMARSAIHHSMNYRCAVVFGRAKVVRDDQEKRAALALIVDHVVPGRSAEARPPTGRELGRTMVVRVGIEEASAKVRSGPPLDDEDDMGLEVWAGVVPVKLGWGEPQPDDPVAPGGRSSVPRPSIAAAGGRSPVPAADLSPSIRALMGRE